MSKRKMSRKPSYVFDSEEDDDDFVGAKPKRTKPTKAKDRKEGNKENSPLTIDKSATKKVRERLSTLSSSGDIKAPPRKVVAPITIIDSDSDFSENCPSQKNVSPAPESGKSRKQDTGNEIPANKFLSKEEEDEKISTPSPKSAPESEGKYSGEESEGSGLPSSDKIEGLQVKRESPPPSTRPSPGAAPKSSARTVQPDTSHKPKKMAPVLKSSTGKATPTPSKPALSKSTKPSVTPVPSKPVLSKEKPSAVRPALVPSRKNTTSSTSGSFQGTPIKLGLSKSAKMRTLHSNVKR